MRSVNKYVIGFLALAIFFVLGFSDAEGEKEDFTERVKIGLRDVGNKLLLSNQDTTSLILPVVELERSKYRLAFENQISLEPGNLVTIVKESLEKAELPRKYRVEVIRCSDKEVAYSYEIKNDTEKDIIPCAGRFLPKNCYYIELRFTNEATLFYGNGPILYFLGFSALSILALLFYKRKPTGDENGVEGNPTVLGSFQFYPDQNKLVKAAKEINLSKKECELLEIFVANPNQIIKRDELTKRVWEDNGVFVGRSLDTYISKLRKKLQDDESIKLTNIHGVGYKLEVESN